MRLHPSVALTMPRHVPAGGCEIAGEFFPAGMKVGINPAVIHLDQDIFGPDANEFVPERWFRGDTTIMDKHMLHFGGGSRTCVGKNVSLFSYIPLWRLSTLTPATTDTVTKDISL
jgi:cytochrome P450